MVATKRLELILLDYRSSVLPLYYVARWNSERDSNPQIPSWKDGDFNQFCLSEHLVARAGIEPAIYSMRLLSCHYSILQNMVPMKGVEPPTYCLQDSCSSNWATLALVLRTGLEPARDFAPGILRPCCLPIPAPEQMVRIKRFELPTSRSQAARSTKLSYILIWAIDPYLFCMIRMFLSIFLITFIFRFGLASKIAFLAYKLLSFASFVI